MEGDSINMKHNNELSSAAYDFYAKMPLSQAIPLGLQHVLAMFVGNLTPLLIIAGACGISAGSEFADLQVELLHKVYLKVQFSLMVPFHRNHGIHFS